VQLLVDVTRILVDAVVRATVVESDVESIVLVVTPSFCDFEHISEKGQKVLQVLAALLFDVKVVHRESKRDI
jgi:hypothetical protein